MEWLVHWMGSDILVPYIGHYWSPQVMSYEGLICICKWVQCPSSIHSMLWQQPGLKVVQQYGHMGNYIMFMVSNNMVIMYCYRVVKNMIWFCMASVQHLSLTITVDRSSKSFGLTNDLLAGTVVDSSRLPKIPHLMQPATAELTTHLSTQMTCSSLSGHCDG